MIFLTSSGISPISPIFFLIKELLIMSFIGWAGLARVIRGMVLSIREKEFVTAAVASGEQSLRIIIRYILPNTLSYVIVGGVLVLTLVFLWIQRVRETRAG